MLPTKRIALLFSFSPLLLFTQALSAQSLYVLNPGKDQPAYVRIFENGNMHRFIVPDWQENPVIELNGEDETYQVDLGFLNEEGQPPQANPLDQFFEYYDPGVPIEGDMPSDGEYTKDGTIFAFIYQQSDNVIFYSSRTYDILASVQVARQPVDLEMGEDHAYVACHEGKGVVEISLDDFSVSNYIAVNGTPCQVQVSPGDDTVYIACNSWLDGWITAVDLNTNQLIYESYNPWIHGFGHAFEIGRTRLMFTTFNLSPKGNKFIAGDTTTGPTIFNACTGIAERTYHGGLRGADFSPSGDTLYAYAQYYDSMLMYRINMADNSVIDSIKAFGDIFLLVEYSDLAINKDGSKVIAGDGWNGQYYLFDFNTHSCQVIDQPLLDLVSPIYASSDGEYAVASFSDEVEFISFGTGQTYNTWSADISPEWPMCVSPVENKLVVGNGPFFIPYYDRNNEYLYSFIFKDIDSIYSDTAIICGEIPEADVPDCAVLSNDGEKILAANLLSHNLSIIDFDDHLVDTVIHLNEMSEVKVVPGSDLAIVYGRNTNRTWIISLTDYEILKEFIGLQAMDAFVTSDGQTAYLIQDMGIHQMKISKINIDGANSSIQLQNTVGGDHCTWNLSQDYVFSTFALSPDEHLLLIGYDHPQQGNVINIIDTETLDLLTSVPVPEYCIYDFAFTDDSKRVIAAGYNHLVPIIYLDRENSFVENYVEINNNSFSAAYNPVDSLFYVLEENNYIYKVDPLTGDIVRYLDTFNEHNFKIRIDKQGMPLVLTSTSVIYDGEAYPMPGSSSFLTYDPEFDLFISAVPGPDMICVFDPKMVGIQQFKPGHDNEVSVFPNPATDRVVIKSSSEIIRVKVCNLTGKEVFSGDFNGHNIEIPTGNLAPGVYSFNIITISGNYIEKVIVGH